MRSQRISIATNASLADSSILQTTIPSWLRVLRDRVADLTVVLDTTPLEGRIARLHSEVEEPTQLVDALRQLKALDSRIKWSRLPEPRYAREVSRRWFGTDSAPTRCQAGTPIMPFIHAAESGGEDIVLRADCDMVFHESGWLSDGVNLLNAGKVDIVEPPRPGTLKASTRAFMVRKSHLFEKILPLRPVVLDSFRGVHRRLCGRTTWLALEQIFQAHIESGSLRHCILSMDTGRSVHLGDRALGRVPAMAEVVERIESGDIPELQLQHNDLVRAAWPEFE